MNKITKVLLTVMLLVSTFSYALIHDCEHVHAVSIGEHYYECPACGSTMRIVSIGKEPTCTDMGVVTVQCENCMSVGIMTELTVDYPALGHDFSIVVSKTDATCTKDGFETLECSRCGTTQGVPIPALGHKYKSKVTKEATCTEDGVKTYTCSRCNKSYTKSIPALGHNVEYEEKEATCTEDGYKKGVCKRCGDKVEEIFPALGHDVDEFTVIKEATCEEDGLKEAICKRCNETVEETIEKLGHDYPEEWTVEKEAGFFAEGLKVKVCKTCGKRLEEAIPKKNILPVILGGLGGITVLGVLLYFLRRSGRLGKKLVEEVTKEAIKPSFETKTILAVTKDEKLVELLKKQSYLKIVSGEYADIAKDFKENEPDLIIADILSEERLDEVLELKKEEELKDGSFGLVVSQEIIDDRKKKLDKLVKDKKITGYVPFGKADYSALVRLVLPVLRPVISYGK